MIEIVETILNLPLINPITTTKQRSYTITFRDDTNTHTQNLFNKQSKKQVMNETKTHFVIFNDL